MKIMKFPSNNSLKIRNPFTFCFQESCISENEIDISDLYNGEAAIGSPFNLRVDPFATKEVIEKFTIPILEFDYNINYINTRSSLIINENYIPLLKNKRVFIHYTTTNSQRLAIIEPFFSSMQERSKAFAFLKHHNIDVYLVYNNLIIDGNAKIDLPDSFMSIPNYRSECNIELKSREKLTIQNIFHANKFLLKTVKL